MGGNTKTHDQKPRILPASTELIESIWRRWGLPIVSTERTYLPGDVAGLYLEGGADGLCGLVTWAVQESMAEVVSLDAFEPGRGFGARLLGAAEAILKSSGVERVFLITTNDNLDALRFYLRQGYRLVRIHPDAMDRVRKIKPSVPENGKGGVPLRDMWELEKPL